MRHGAAAQASRRLHAIDAARGVALAGMIVINVGPTSPETLAERLYLLPYGRASILFVVVAGIGMGLFLRSRRTGLRPWPTLTWRAVLLVLGGLALQRMTDDIGVILPIYGVLFACAPALQRLAGRALIATAGLLTFAGPALLVAHVQSEGVRHFTEPVALGDPPIALLHNLALSGRYPLATWIVPFLVGLWLVTHDLRAQRVQERMIVWGGGTAVAAFAVAQASVIFLGPTAEAGYWRLLTGAAHGQMPLWLVSSIAGAAFVVGLLLRLRDALGALVRPLAMTGRMSLTWYVLHVVILAAVTPDGGFTFTEGAVVSATLIVAFMGLSVAWGGHGRTGPLAWLMRITWWERWAPRSRAVHSPARQTTP